MDSIAPPSQLGIWAALYLMANEFVLELPNGEDQPATQPKDLVPSVPANSFNPAASSEQVDAPADGSDINVDWVRTPKSHKQAVDAPKNIYSVRTTDALRRRKFPVAILRSVYTHGL